MKRFVFVVSMLVCVSTVAFAVDLGAVKAKLGVDELVFVKRDTYQSNHYYTDHINGCRFFGGNICILNLNNGSVREIVDSMKHGIFGRIDLSFDAKKIVFAWKEKIGVGFRIYEVNVDGSGLRQLTFPPDDEDARIKKYKINNAYQHHTDDMNPCYLPDGGICFISSRCEFGILCDAPDLFTTTVLYRIDGDGKNMQKLSNSSVSEQSPSVMNDGRILYTRWEYVDKGAVSAKCLWAMRPDGTGSAEVYGNDISLPPTFLHGKAIPGHNNLFVMLGTPHYPQSGVGTVILVDTNKDIRTKDPMTYITPDVDIRGEGGFNHKVDGRWVRSQNGPLFMDPYPISEKLFLVSHNPDKHWKDRTAWGLYLLNEKGETTPIYDDPGTSCWVPIPLKSRRVPPVPMTVIDERTAKKNLATVIVSDIYHGMEGVNRGTIKYIRVNEQIPRPWGARRFWGGDGYDQQHATISKDTNLGLRVQHGIVPVYKDGSAHFVVPADRNIFFQALDENHMEVQRERTFVNYRPGETRTCIGCHETPKDAPLGRRRVMEAIKHAPSKPGPQPGEKTGKRVLDFAYDVQPVLDKHCIKCHSGEKPKAGLNLSGEMTRLFSRSYESLIPERRGGKGRRSFDLVGPTIGENHPKTGNVHYLPAKSLGSHASVLVSMLNPGKVKLKDPKMAAIAEKLAKKHKKVKMSKEEMIRLTTWVDANGQYYGTYYGRKNIKYKDHPNFRPHQTVEQAQGLLPPIPEDKR
ncbi:MAG: hypothetical protein FVQ82_09390 [Planctomycetes bacterium]|nr:hypothetical protein [Planctomycetota bacterium]